jgi:hypothetical protein
MADRIFTGEQIILPATDDDWEGSGFWEDLRFPGTGAGADTSTGRLYTNYAEAMLVFASNARYDEEPWIMNVQLPHGWVEGSGFRPHLHWMQEEDNDPNWLLTVRGARKGDEILAPGFFGFSIPDVKRVYTYANRTHQITSWAETILTGYTVSDMVQLILYRDTANESGLFDGSDPYSLDAKVLEFDVHILMENLGSPNEYYKGS